MFTTIVSWRDRDELHQAIPSLIAEAAQNGGEVVVVNYGGNRERLRRQLDGFDEKIRVVSIESNFFNKPKAHNIGASYAQYPILFFCDCDIIVDLGSITTLANELAQSTGTFATLGGVKETEQNSRRAKHVACFGYEMMLRTTDGREVKIVDNEEDAANGTRQAPGLLLVRRDDFYSINGYNSQLDGWGWEDQDMICRLTLGAGLRRISRGQASHISHDDLARVQAYPLMDRWESRDKMFRRALANYDNANFLGTYDVDVAQAGLQSNI